MSGPIPLRSPASRAIPLNLPAQPTRLRTEAPAGSPRATTPHDPHAALRRTAHEFEAVFLRQLLQEMRKSVPDGGLLPKTGAEDMFHSMLDDRLATEATKGLERGLGEKLYRQLARRLDEGAVKEKP